MASFEDLEVSGDIEKKPVLKDTSRVVNGEYIPPSLERYSENKAIAKPEPVKCKGSGKCRMPAVIRPVFHGQGAKDLCSLHWDKVKNNIDSYESSPMWIHNDSELHKDIRVENARENQRAKARDAATIYQTTGIEKIVQGPGRPIKPETEDHVTPVIDKVASGGGHIRPDHENKLYAAHQALLAAIDQGNGTPDATTYHRFAEVHFPDPAERSEYFIHAMNHHKKLMGRSVTPAADPVKAASADFNMNGSTAADNLTFDSMNDLLKDSGAPSRRDSGLRGERND